MEQIVQLYIRCENLHLVICSMSVISDTFPGFLPPNEINETKS